MFHDMTPISNEESPADRRRVCSRPRQPKVGDYNPTGILKMIRQTGQDVCHSSLRSNSKLHVLVRILTVSKRRIDAAKTDHAGQQLCRAPCLSKNLSSNHSRRFVRRFSRVAVSSCCSMLEGPPCRAHNAGRECRCRRQAFQPLLRERPTRDWDARSQGRQRKDPPSACSLA